MMKKYNTPEIEALALETIDVIAASGNGAAQAALAEKYQANVAVEGEIKNEFVTTTGWNW